MKNFKEWLGENQQQPVQQQAQQPRQYYIKRSTEYGPFDSSQLKNMSEKGAISPDDFIMQSSPTTSKWVQANTVKGLKVHQGGVFANLNDYLPQQQDLFPQSDGDQQPSQQQPIKRDRKSLWQHWYKLHEKGVKSGSGNAEADEFYKANEKEMGNIPVGLALYGAGKHFLRNTAPIAQNYLAGRGFADIIS